MGPSAAIDINPVSPGETPEQTWARLQSSRSRSWDRAVRNAALTIPEICPDDGELPDDVDTQTTWQSIGAEGVNHLTNKVVVAMFRPSVPFFKLDPEPEITEAWQQENPQGRLDDMVAQCAAIERAAVKEWAGTDGPSQVHVALMTLIVQGHTVIWDDPETDIRVIPFSSYAMKRDVLGDLFTLVIAEQVAVSEIHPHFQKYIDQDTHKSGVVTIYTRFQKTGKDKYRMDRALDSQVIPEMSKTYPRDKLPVSTPVWRLVPGASYGRSLIDQIFGDIQAYDSISEAAALGGQAAAEFRMLVSPAGMTQIQDVQNSQNGDALPGLPADIGIVQGGSPQALQFLLSLQESYQRKLARNFLMETEVIRDAERVTAEEVRRIALELESRHAGIYASLGKQLQLPLARWILSRIGFKETKGFKIQILTGHDALSRSVDLQNFMSLVNILAGIEQLPQGLKDRLDWEAVASFAGAGTGVDVSKFLLPEDQVQAKQAQTQAMLAEAQAAGTAAGTPPPQLQ